MANLKKYVEGGGSVFIDPATGEQAFVDAMTKALHDAFGADSLNRLPSAHPLLTGEFGEGMGSDVRAVDFTPELAKEQKDDHAPEVWGLYVRDRMAVIFCGMGVTNPAEGVPSHSCRGLATPDARRLACNVLLYVARAK